MLKHRLLIKQPTPKELIGYFNDYTKCGDYKCLLEKSVKYINDDKKTMKEVKSNEEYQQEIQCRIHTLQLIKNELTSENILHPTAWGILIAILPFSISSIIGAMLESINKIGNELSNVMLNVLNIFIIIVAIIALLFIMSMVIYLLWLYKHNNLINLEKCAFLDLCIDKYRE